MENISEPNFMVSYELSKGLNEKLKVEWDIEVKQRNFEE